jgi:predicted  nucleic acid-binding Zn-ribbon protein
VSELKKTNSDKSEVLSDYNVRLDEEILDAEQVAEILNSSKKMVERELREKKLKGYKRLGKWFILKTDLIYYIRTGNTAE